MKTKCLISCENELMIIGLSSLLSKHNDVDINRIQPQEKIELQALIDRYRPDVLVIDRQSKFYSYLFCNMALIQNRDMLVVVLELDRNLMQIYFGGEMVEKSNADLISVIRNRGPILT